MFTRKSPFVTALWLALALLLPALPAAAQDDGGRYGYFRVLEGSATLVEAESKTQTPVEINQPVLAGDQILVARSSRLEVVLPDDTLVRVDGGSDLTFSRIADSPDSGDPSTQLTLAAGNVQIVVPDDYAGEDPPRVDTPNATFYLRDAGSYRVTSDQGDWSSLVVREGSAEAVTRRGSLIVRADEEATVEGEGFAEAEVQAASSTDGLEVWGRRLDEEARGADRYVDSDLGYEAAPLSRHGSWIDIEGSRYWRPTSVESGWRPYWHGRWVYTPSGLTWVPYEPWGWVTAHYGSWDYFPSWGWAWRPGHVYSPAWVYWYWGPRYVGWCPTGYYTSFYGRHHGGFGVRYGVYGWAGGDWGAFGDWNFVPAGYVGTRDQHRFTRRGRDLGGERGPRLDRGLITTDTSPVDIGRYRDPEQRLRLLRERRGRGGAAGEDLPDVTPFIARNPELPPRVLRSVVADGPETQVLRRGRNGAGRLRTQTAETPQPAAAGSGPVVEPGKPGGTEGRGGDNWRERGNRTWQRPANGGRPRIEIGGRDETPRERPGRGEAGESPRARERESERGPRAEAPQEQPREPERRPRAEAPEDRPRARAPEDRPQGRAPEDRPQGRAPEDRPQARAPEDRPRAEAPEERPRAQEPEERPRVEIRERGPERERPAIETRERERPPRRDRDSADEPPPSRRLDSAAQVSHGPAAGGDTGADDSWRRSTESRRRPQPGPRPGATEAMPYQGPGRREVRTARPDRPTWQPAPRDAGQEGRADRPERSTERDIRRPRRPRTVEPYVPRVYAPPSRPADRPTTTYTPRSRPQPPADSPPRVSVPSRPADRPAPPTVRSAPQGPRQQPGPRQDRGNRGDGPRRGRPNNGGK